LDLNKVRRKDMALQMHLETLASGMHAKLNSRYRTQNNQVRIIKNNNSAKKFYPSTGRTGFLGDMNIKHKTFV
jgi:hypothetical protein